MPRGKGEGERPPEFTGQSGRHDEAESAEDNLPALFMREQQGRDEPGTFHERLVKTLRSFIQQAQREQRVRGYGIGGEAAPLEGIIQENLEPLALRENVGGADNARFWDNIRLAWNALVYERYETGSTWERHAGFSLQLIYRSLRQPTIKLSHPMQVRVLDALAEAADIPHQRGQTEIEIPEKLREYDIYRLSDEYRERLADNLSRARRKNP